MTASHGDKTKRPNTYTESPDDDEIVISNAKHAILNSPSFH